MFCVNPGEAALLASFRDHLDLAADVYDAEDG